MANGLAEKAFGTTLVKTQSGSEVEDLPILNLTSIGEIGLESEEIDVTDFDSPDSFREFMMTLKDAGEVPIAGFIKTESFVETMLELANSQSLEEFTITFPSGSTWVFDAFVKAYKEGELTTEGVRNFTGSLRISGKPVYTPAEDIS